MIDEITNAVAALTGAGSVKADAEPVAPAVAEPVAAPVPAADEDLPAFLDRSKPEGPKPRTLIPYAGKEPSMKSKGKLPVPPPKSQVSVLKIKSDTPEAKAILAEKAAAKSAKAKAKKEKAKAVKSGATTKMPLEGKAAVAAIKAARKANAKADKAANLKAAQKGAVKALAKATSAAVKEINNRAGTKTALIADLLRRKQGCTAKEVMEAAKWPSVSMPAQAKACGLKLRKEKVPGEPTRYFGS